MLRKSLFVSAICSGISIGYSLWNIYFERNGFITKLDDYMIAEVAKLQADWISKGIKIVPISVNVSIAYFTRENLAEHICEIVDNYNVLHKAIVLLYPWMILVQVTLH